MTTPKLESQTPRFDAAYKECLDDAGNVTRLEPLYNLARRLEFETRQAVCDSVRCQRCGNYLGGHATGAGDICCCNFDDNFELWPIKLTN